MNSSSRSIKNWSLSEVAGIVSEIVAKESGNFIGKNQESMVNNRLKKRMLDLGSLTPTQYYEHLMSNYNDEVGLLVSLLTTHHTFFFREFIHFEYILNNLDLIVTNVKKRGDSKIRILSAACSRGQEVYSLSMFLRHHLHKYPGISYEIVGNDIDPQSVKIAQNGVYPYSEVKSIPQVYVSGNWQRGTGDISRFARVKPSIKDACSFGVMNLLDLDSAIRNEKFDLIFCRNVFIYFEQDSIEKIVSNFTKYIHKGGLLITGISESLKSLSIQKQTMAPSIYCFDPIEKKETISSLNSIPEAKIIPNRSTIPTPIKVLAVDDSSSVLKLLTRIFSTDPDFELVGTAKDGIEAKKFVENNHVDAMTLDIHMPEMDGVTYLKENYKKGHPHVVVVSSASREDTRYAQETLKYGAADFVEKPALNNLLERAEEIKNKIKMSFFNAAPDKTSIDQSFQRDFSISKPEEKGRSFIASFSDKEKVLSTILSFQGEQPPVFVFFEGNSNFLGVIKDEFRSLKNLELFEEGMIPIKNKVYLCDFKTQFHLIQKNLKGRLHSISVFGIVSGQVEKMLLSLDKSQVLIEDLPGINESIKEVASDVFPWTSFSHVGTEYLSKE